MRRRRRREDEEATEKLANLPTVKPFQFQLSPLESQNHRRLGLRDGFLIE